MWRIAHLLCKSTHYSYHPPSLLYYSLLMEPLAMKAYRTTFWRVTENNHIHHLGGKPGSHLSFLTPSLHSFGNGDKKCHTSSSCEERSGGSIWKPWAHPHPLYKITVTCLLCLFKHSYNEGLLLLARGCFYSVLGVGGLSITESSVIGGSSSVLGIKAEPRKYLYRDYS